VFIGRVKSLKILRLLQGMGTGAVLEAMCEYRVQECVTMARALQAMNAGEHSLQFGQVFAC
jgi:hypothetical protein